MPESRSRRPAHRPSRRHQLIESAVELFAVKPPDLVTIAEIVQTAGMTPAAFYYHFSSREELLQEVVAEFAEEWADRAEEWWGEARSVADILSVVGRLLDWAVERRDRATVYFVASKGVAVTIEDTRRAATKRTSAAAAGAICRATNSRLSARTGLDGLSIVTVVESALRGELALDTTYRTLGPRRFRDEVFDLCARVIGVSPEVA